MARWSFGVLLVACLAALMWSGAKADDAKYGDHACTYFYRMDANGDLRLTLSDFIRLAWKIITSGKTLFRILTDLFTVAHQARDFFPLVDESLIEAILTDGVSLKEFLVSMTAIRNTDDMSRGVNKTARFIHKTFGTNMVLTKDQLAVVYYVYSIDQSAVDAGFAELDTNKDGVVTLEECSVGGIHYFNEDGLNQLWAGPVVTCMQVAKNDPTKLP